MLKADDLLKTEQDGVEAVVKALRDVPDLAVMDVIREGPGQDRGIDFVVQLDIAGERRVLLCEVKMNGSPKAARQAIHQLISYQSRHSGYDHPHEALVFVAPYVSPQVRAVCQDFEVNYCDFVGNCRIVLPGLYIDRQVAQTPVAEKRNLRSLFKPKSARVLRYLLNTAPEPKRLTEIAEATEVSIGQVHKLKTALTERDWIEETPDGVVIRNPDRLIDAWRAENEPPPGLRTGYYTALHGRALDDAVEAALVSARGGAALSGRTAATWLAPWLTPSAVELYADEASTSALVELLGLQAAPKGPNVWITTLQDIGPLMDAVEVRPGVRVTSPLQTYLDLSRGGERDREAADHLRKELLPW